MVRVMLYVKGDFLEKFKKERSPRPDTNEEYRFRPVFVLSVKGKI